MKALLLMTQAAVAVLLMCSKSLAQFAESGFPELQALVQLPEQDNAKIAAAIGNGDPQRLAAGALAQNNFNYIAISYGWGFDFIGIDCQLEPVSQLRYGIDVGDVRGGHDFESRVLLLETYAALYNRELVNSDTYPYKDICVESTFLGRNSRYTTWPRLRVNWRSNETPPAPTLHAAARFNDVNAANAFVKSNSNLNSVDEWGMTPLGWSAGRGHSKIVEMLLQNGADPTTASGQAGLTPLAWAAIDNRIAIATLLLVAGANPDLSGENAWFQTRPLNIAAEKGHLEFVNLLLSGGANPNLLNKYEDNTALMAAAKNNKLKVVKALLNARADVSLLGTGYGGYASGNTALNQAVLSGNPDIVKAVLSAGANIDQTNEYGGRSALHVAVDEEDLYMTALLLELEADVNVGAEKRRAIDGRIFSDSPLHIAAWNNNFAAVRMLLENGASMEAVGEVGRTPLLSVAGSSRGADMAVFLIENGASVKVADFDGNTALLRALQRISPQSARKPLIELLVASGVNMRAANTKGETALHEACVTENVTLFLENGADIEAKNNSGETPLLANLWWACEDGAIALSEAGADLSVTDKNGKTVSEIAQAKKLTKVLAYLEDL